MGEQLHITFSVVDCLECHGNHDPAHFTPGEGPQAGQTHWTTCPVTGGKFWMNTQANPGVWERLLKAAGL